MLLRSLLGERHSDQYVRLALIALATGGLLAALAILAGSLRLVLAPAGPGVALPADRMLTDSGIPVPASAQRCEVQGGSSVAQERWCVPASVTAPALTRWYASALPAERDSGELRWCTRQLLVDGVQRSVWFDGEALLGHVLPSQDAQRSSGQRGDDGTAVAVFRVPASGCPTAVGSTRQS